MIQGGWERGEKQEFRLKEAEVRKPVIVPYVSRKAKLYREPGEIQLDS